MQCEQIIINAIAARSGPTAGDGLEREKVEISFREDVTPHLGSLEDLSSLTANRYYGILILLQQPTAVSHKLLR